MNNKLMKFGAPFTLGVIIIILASLISELYGLAYTYIYFDKGLHVAGGLIAGWIVYRFLERELSLVSSIKFLLILVSGVLFIGVFWEFAEYWAGQNKDTYPLLYRYFRGGGLADTLLDLAADMLGALMFGLLILRERYLN